jgi:hypothetical protein
MQISIVRRGDTVVRQGHHQIQYGPDQEPSFIKHNCLKSSELVSIYINVTVNARSLGKPRFY